MTREPVEAMRRSVVALALVCTVACGGAGSGASPALSAPPESSPPNSASPSRTTTALEGTWAIDEVTVAEALATIREHGFGRRALGVFLDDLDVSEWFGLTLKFSGQDYSLFGSPEGGDLTPWDYGSTFTVEGDILTLVYSSPGGTTTFRWAITGDRLELELLEDDQPDHLGLPTELWVSGLFTVEPFVRVGP
jgi:hypothetical protein